MSFVCGFTRNRKNPWEEITHALNQFQLIINKLHQQNRTEKLLYETKVFIPIMQITFLSRIFKYKILGVLYIISKQQNQQRRQQMQKFTNFLHCCTMEKRSEKEIVFDVRDKRLNPIKPNRQYLKRLSKSFDFGRAKNTQKNKQNGQKNNEQFGGTSTTHTFQQQNLTASQEPKNSSVSKEEKINWQIEQNMEAINRNTSKRLFYHNRLKTKKAQQFGKFINYQHYNKKSPQSTKKHNSSGIQVITSSKSIPKKEPRIQQNLLSNQPQKQALKDKVADLRASLSIIEEKMSSPSVEQSFINPQLIKNTSSMVYEKQINALKLFPSVVEIHPSQSKNKSPLNLTQSKTPNCNLSLNSTHKELDSMRNLQQDVSLNSLIQNKLLIDIKIFQTELRSLQEQGESLKRQKQYTKQRFQEDFRKINCVKEKLLVNVQNRYNDIVEIEQLLSTRQNQDHFQQCQK